MQGSGTAIRLAADIFQRALEERPAFRAVLLRYAMAFNVQVTMTAACNGRHLVEQRLARWLLMAHDRTVGDEFVMTHEFLSVMLGVRRAGVTVAAGALQRTGSSTMARRGIRDEAFPGLDLSRPFDSSQAIARAPSPAPSCARGRGPDAPTGSLEHPATFRRPDAVPSSPAAIHDQLFAERTGRPPASPGALDGHLV